MVVIQWTFSVDAERVTELLVRRYGRADVSPCEVVDAMLEAAEAHAGTTLGLRWQHLADELGAQLDRLPRRPLSPEERDAARDGIGPFIPAPREPVGTCPTCQSTPVYIGVPGR